MVYAIIQWHNSEEVARQHAQQLADLQTEMAELREALRVANDRGDLFKQNGLDAILNSFFL